MSTATPLSPTTAVKGTQEWTSCEIVLDVPSSAHGLVFGALLAGKGQLWVDNLRLEIVEPNVPTTNAYIFMAEQRAQNEAMIKSKMEELKRTNPQKAAENEKARATLLSNIPAAPINLDFENK